VILAKGQDIAPWRALALGPRAELDALSLELQAVGALAGGDEHFEAARILAGWPALGREIGEKTLPQEVRYDEIGGVSYTKGCYVGQETVARVHFRGHPNRQLRGLLWDGEGVAPGQGVSTGEREVGRLGSVLEVGTRHYGLAVIRREVGDGAIVTVGRIATARVCELPFAL
jgi:folate-binding protein YgfZ